MEEGNNGNRKEVYGPMSIFRCPQMELCATRPSDLNWAYPESALD